MKTIRNFEMKVRRVKLADAGEPYHARVREPEDVMRIAQLLIGDRAEESFVVIILDIKNRVLGYSETARGSVDACPVDMRAAFRTAVVLGASAVIAAHCHPRGDPNPSGEDLVLTERLKAAGELLGIQLLDHVVVTDEDTVSLRGRGLIA
ncbi:RadC family protein [Myxococcota bacterium]